MNLNILQNIERNSIDFFDFYLFLFVAIVLVISKLNNPSFSNKLFNQMSIKKGAQKDFGFGFTSISLNISYVLLISYGFYVFFAENRGFYVFSHFFLVTIIFYIIQIAGIFVFEKIIETKEPEFTFLKLKLSYNEASILVLLPSLLIVDYAPFSTKWFFIALIVVFQSFNMVRTSIYLARYIAIFHIILYLCTLEIILILFLIKHLLAI